jgi:hypothetical protein
MFAGTPSGLWPVCDPSGINQILVHNYSDSAQKTGRESFPSQKTCEFRGKTPDLLRKLDAEDPPVSAIPVGRASLQDCNLSRVDARLTDLGGTYILKKQLSSVSSTSRHQFIQQASFMLIRQILAALLLLTLSIGSSPAALVLLHGDDDSNQHSSGQPLKDSEEENEESESEWDQVEVLYSGLFATDVEHLPVVYIARYDELSSFTQLVLSSPDHSRAPPARA